MTQNGPKRTQDPKHVQNDPVWAQNVPKWAQMSKPMSWKEPKWPQMSFNKLKF